jgi:xanthine/uracil permease
MTVAFPLMIALIISFMPAAVAESMPPVLRPLLANGFVMGVIAVLLMEHVIYRNNRR